MTDHIDLGLVDPAAASCTCCSPAISAATDTPAAATPAVAEEILVSGMTCAHCVATVTEELTGIDGVQNVTVDLHAGGTSRVTIQRSVPISDSAVKGAVEKAGYALANSRA